MNKIKFLVGLITALFIVGCANNVAEPALGQQQRVVKNIGEHYYYVPAYAQGFKLSKKLAYLNNVVSSGLLDCKENYAFIESNKVKAEMDKPVKDYYASLTVEELKQVHYHPTAIPKRDGKEFQKIIEVETLAVRNGEAGCIPPMPKKQVKEYKTYLAKQAEINNDPRVIAARIQANAQLQQARMEKESRDRAATQQSLQNLNQQLQNMTPKTYNVNVMHY